MEEINLEEMVLLKKNISSEIQNTLYEILKERGCVWLDRAPLENFEINDSTTQNEIDRIMNEVMHRDLYACFRDYLLAKKLNNLSDLFNLVYANVQLVRAVWEENAYYMEINEEQSYYTLPSAVIFAADNNAFNWGLKFALCSFKKSLGYETIFDYYREYGSKLRPGFIKVLTDFTEEEPTVEKEGLVWFWLSIYLVSDSYKTTEGKQKHIVINDNTEDYMYESTFNAEHGEFFIYDVLAIRDLCENMEFAKEHVKGLDGYLHPDKYFLGIMEKLIAEKCDIVSIEASEEEKMAVLTLFERMNRDCYYDWDYDRIRPEESKIWIEFPDGEWIDKKAIIYYNDNAEAFYYR